jgi:hypothetical protein
MIAYIFVNSAVWVYYYSEDLELPAAAAASEGGVPLPADWTHEGRCHIQPLNLHVRSILRLSWVEWMLVSRVLQCCCMQHRCCG